MDQVEEGSGKLEEDSDPTVSRTIKSWTRDLRSDVVGLKW